MYAFISMDGLMGPVFLARVYHVMLHLTLAINTSDVAGILDLEC